jgi:hypothetical protein
MASTTTHLPSRQYFDLVVIGAGPAALSLVARILEKWPAALYTEEEQRHLLWLHRTDHGRSRAFLKTGRVGRGSDRYIKGVKHIEDRLENGGPNQEDLIRILVVDKSGGWMKLWNKLFEAYDIHCE